MAYDPDVMNKRDILQAKNVFLAPDRQKLYDDIYNHLIKKFGVSIVGDRMTVRTENADAHFVLLDIDLRRDIYRSDNK